MKLVAATAIDDPSEYMMEKLGSLRSPLIPPTRHPPRSSPAPFAPSPLPDRVWGWGFLWGERVAALPAALPAHVSCSPRKSFFFPPVGIMLKLAAAVS